MAMVTTIHGDMEETALVKSEGDFEDDNECTHWIEYRLPGSDEIVHRSAHVVLKQPLSADALAALFGNQ
ncbi:hypothetical protein B0G84_5734 [Paraburkholderia sp. BL8N3]|nr:hypothetical protein [Paraburkholderia sp. BL8N3]TCK36721.1 hypothetical protein B0G84_5734 [Paraburkholderia sp. BL8N3]